ncbi:MAG: hypothetical protein FJ042_02110 [Candidatus Cloacimonetes bacterium]|nr:hypothetical protein [Candidatus Cloacimonadota bacterium]
MQFRFVKDLAIALIFIIVMILAGQLYFMYRGVEGVKDDSRHITEAVSDTLMNRIRTIESSIQDRKMFAFNVNRDPLRQGNIIKDKLDLEKEYEDMVRNTFRLSSVAKDEYGESYANIEYQGKNYIARVQSVIEGRRILAINVDSISYFFNGRVDKARIEARPPRPTNTDAQDKSQFNF